MRKMTMAICVGGVLTLGFSAANADGPHFGKPITEADVAPWDISVGPDGVGLPPGSGTPAQGAVVYVDHGCPACHGDNGSGGLAGALVGGGPLNDPNHEPAKQIGNYWPYATTIFDFVRRAMPWQQPKTLTNDEVYSLTAYVLALNKIIGDSDVINAETLPKVKMPNRDGFIIRYPEKH
jgi:cytochrome c